MSYELAPQPLPSEEDGEPQVEGTIEGTLIRIPLDEPTAEQRRELYRTYREMGYPPIVGYDALLGEDENGNGAERDAA